MPATKFVGQWAKLAGINPKAISQGHIDHVAEKMGKGLYSYNDAELDKIFSEFDTDNTLAQYGMLICAFAVADSNGRTTNQSCLAEEILAQQGKRIKKYRQRAYPMTANQVRVILKEVLPYRSELNSY